MNDYCKGAFEALSWVESLIESTENRPEALEEILKEVNAAIREIREGIAVNFKSRLRSTFF